MKINMEEIGSNGSNQTKEGVGHPEESGPLLDDKLIEELTPNVSILEGFEDGSSSSFCAKCRTISNSFLASSPYQSRSNATRGRISVGEPNNDVLRFYAPADGLGVDPSSSDDAPLIDVFDDDAGLENGRDFGTFGPEHCHTSKPFPKTTRRTITKLMLACSLTTIFMIGEAVGGWLANSIAIMSDAAHLLSDLTSFIVSLVAIFLAMRPASKKMNYGYQRAEVLGAVISVLIIWLITGVLVYIAVERIISMEFEVEADTMIIVAAVGVVFNIVLGFVLHSSHSHGHSHGGHSPSPPQSSDGGTDTNNNINLRAAFIHVVGDLVQSIGVLISAYIIRYYPQYKIADPICTFIFSAIVVATTIPILKDLSIVLMEGTPPGTDYNILCSHLAAIPGVKMVHSLHVWALTLDKNALSVHLAVSESCDPEAVLKDAQRVIRYRHHIDHTTIQVEKYQPLLMDNCQQCQPLAS